MILAGSGDLIPVKNRHWKDKNNTSKAPLGTTALAIRSTHIPSGERLSV